MPLFALAIPVLHSSGAWIAYAGSGYLAGTLSGSWVGAFILGNSGLLAGTGLISAAGLAGAAGVLTGLGAGAAAATGVLLTNIGLGGVASWLGIAPVATFLGLTPFGWVIGGSLVVGVTVVSLLTRKTVRTINEERAKGGLEPTSVKGIIKEVKAFEKDAMLRIIERIAVENDDVRIGERSQSVFFKGVGFSIPRLKYVINDDGSEEIVFVSKLGKKNRVYLVREPRDDFGVASA